jgi:transcriptional regulator with XRE-family HTH domain
LGQRPNELTPHASPQHYLGAEMRAWRDRRGFSLAKLGKLVLFDASYMARAERGAQAASADLVRAYDRALGAEGSLIRLHQSISDGGGRPAPAEVDVARSGRHVADQVTALAGGIDGPASSGEGISIPIRTDDGRTTFVPISRRSLIAALGASATITTFANSAPSFATTRRSGLAAAGDNPMELLRATRKVLVDNDNLFGPRQMIPVVRRHVAAIKELRVDSTGANRRQLLQMQGQFAELCGWFYQDLGDFHEAKFWLHEALEAAQMSGDQELATYVLARRSQLAGDMGDRVEAIDMAEVAKSVAAPRSRLAAVAATYGAHGHALFQARPTAPTTTRESFKWRSIQTPTHSGEAGWTVHTSRRNGPTAWQHSMTTAVRQASFGPLSPSSLRGFIAIAACTSRERQLPSPTPTNPMRPPR